MESKVKNNTNIGFVGVLQIVFITLKLLDKINWSWIWVLAPLWISWGLFFVFFGIILFLILITT